MNLPLSTRLLVAALFGCILAAAVWVATGQYSRTQTVRGILVTDVPSVKIFPQRPGRIDTFTLEEGQLVNPGQVMAVVNTDIISEFGTATADVASKAIDERKELVQQSAGLSRAGAMAKREQLAGQMASHSRQIDSLVDQIAMQDEIIASNQMMFDQIEEVFDRGFISQNEYERRRQSLLGSKQSLASLRQTLEQLKAERRTFRSELAQLDILTKRELSSIGESIAALDLEKARYETERSYVIRAPIAGRVAAIQTAKGRQVSGQSPLLVIVPADAQLRARLYAPSTAIGMVESGQKTSLLLDAFPYQRFGSIDGKIIKVSRAVLDPKDADVPFAIDEPVYQIEAQLERQTIKVFGDEIPLQPGMALSANIVLERQTFLDWLLTPLNAVLNRT